MDVNRALELLICGLAVAGGLCGVFWPRLFLSSLEEQYTPSRARITGLVILLMGLCGLVAILHNTGAPAEFFPV